MLIYYGFELKLILKDVYERKNKEDHYLKTSTSQTFVVENYLNLQKKTANAVVDQKDNSANLYYRENELIEKIIMDNSNNLKSYEINIKEITSVTNDISNLDYAANIFSNFLMDQGYIDRNIKFLFDYTKTTTYKINEEKKIKILFDKNTATIKLLH